jgi:hypothetical protein
VKAATIGICTLADYSVYIKDREHTLELDASQATSSSTAVVEASWVEGRSPLGWVLPLTFRRHIHLNKS